MSPELLLKYSLVCFVVAFIAIVLLSLLRIKRTKSIAEGIDSKYSRFNFLKTDNTMKVLIVVVFFYLGIILTSEPAYTWLASVVFMILMVFVLVNRIVNYLLVKPTNRIFEIKLKNDTVKTILLVADIISWTALANIMLLFILNIIEVVIPHYLEILL